MEKIAIWADGMWTRMEHIEEYVWASDDYMVKDVSDELSDEEIDTLVHQIVKEVVL